MKQPERIRVALYGLGSMGLGTAKKLLNRRDIILVGAIDTDPKKLNRDVADLSGLKRPSGVRVSDRPEEVLGTTHPDVVLLTTGSRFKAIMPQLKRCIAARANVVSSCEELLYPGLNNPVQTRQIDQLAEGRGVSVLGTGVNPGFVMDTMALAASAPCLELKSITIERVVDVTTRRLNLQKKVGAGLTPAKFRKGVKAGELGHVGLAESMHLVAEGLGWKIDSVKEKVTPVLAKKTIKSGELTVKKGELAGMQHVVRGYRNRKEVLHLNLQMYLGAKKPFDRITVNGKPEVNLLFEGGIAGDEATVAMMVAMIPVAKDLPAGFRTMLDVPIPHFRNGQAG